MISRVRRHFQPLLRCSKLRLNELPRIAFSTTSKTKSIYVEEVLEMYSTPSLSIQHLLVTRHPSPNPALYYEDKATMEMLTLSYGDLDILSSQFATILSSLGVVKGSKIGVMLPKGPHIMIAALAIWRLGAVYVPLFTAFGPDAALIRLKDADAHVAITDESNRFKFEKLVSTLNLNMVTVVDKEESLRSGDTPLSIESLRSGAVPSIPPTKISSDEDIMLLYTSGTTGLPKAVPIPAFALASFHVYMQAGLGLACGDIESAVPSCPLPPRVDSSHPSGTRYQRYLSTADPAWAYGLYYNLIGPLLIGIPATYLSGPFSAPQLIGALSKHRVTHFASSPSALRAVKARDMEGSLGVSDADWNSIASTLQCTSSAGEPLNPEVMKWWEGRLGGKVIADHYGQSEAGMLVNWHWLDSPCRDVIGKY